ncbi:MAG TPA: 16S rRNA (adenine(1518)-N(6)/adenine(1519)-N(6))-dimethyltransferase RsmA [Bacteroidota bacterium]
MNGGIRPRKSLGQHFLRDDRIARRIVASVDPRPGELVLEIGPGEGALTRHLAATDARLVLVDIDSRVIERMRAAFGGRAEVRQQDILEVDPRTVVREHAVERLRVLGNIPYYITTPIFFHFLDHRNVVQDLTLMLQREVARRLAAKPGSKTYGILSVLAGLLADVRLLFEVQPGSFYPRPAVTSAVVQVTMLPHPRFPIPDEEFFRRVVRTAFGQRRKTLRNSLRALRGTQTEAVDGATLARRPEELSVQEFVELASVLWSSRRIGPTPTVAAVSGPQGNR